MRIDWSVRGLRTRMNVQRRRRCTFILSPVLSRRDKTLEIRHPSTADPVMNVQLRPGRQEGADGRPAAGALPQGRGVVTACPGRWYPYLARRRRVWGWCRDAGPPRRAGAREGGGRRRVQVHRAVQCRSESLSRGGVRRSSRRAVRCGDTCQGHCPARSRLAGSTRVRVACDEPGRCVAGRGHGTARLGSGGPRSSRPGSAVTWVGAGGAEVPPRHPRAHYHAGGRRRAWCGLVTSCPRRLGAE